MSNVLLTKIVIVLERTTHISLEKTRRHMLRKNILKQDKTETASAAMMATRISVPDVAGVLVSSEEASHPIDHIFDDRNGPGGTRWIAGQVGEQTLILAFDQPQTLQKLNLEIEEPDMSRTQELSMAVSHDGGQTYREMLRQEYNFSPPHTTYERERWAFPAEAVTHLRLIIRPDKRNKPCQATITSLQLQ
jgi:hypothetical protein